MLGLTQFYLHYASYFISKLTTVLHYCKHSSKIVVGWQRNYGKINQVKSSLKPHNCSQFWSLLRLCSAVLLNNLSQVTVKYYNIPLGENHGSVM